MGILATLLPIIRKTCKIDITILMITLHKNEVSVKNFFSKCDQIRRKLWLYSHLLKKSLMENFISCAV